MAGLDWIPFDTRFPTGPHAIALGVALQDPRAWSHVAQLWAWAALNQADGRFEGPAASATIEVAAGWTGASGALVEAMCLPHIGLLDATERGFYIHNWHVHCGAHIQKRERDRARKRKTSGVKSPRKLRGVSMEDSRNSAQEKEKEKEKDQQQQQPPAAAAAAAETPSIQTDPRLAGAADAAAVLAGRVPQGKAAALAARYPLTARVAKLLEDEWDEPPAHPAQAKRDQVERDIARLGVEHAADLCFEEGERVIERGGEPPRSMGFFADLLASAKPKPADALPPRGPREDPRPGDPDFNNPDAWWDYEAYLRRDAGPARAAGVAHA